MLLVVTRLGPVAQALVALQHFLSPSPLLKRKYLNFLYMRFVHNSCEADAARIGMW